MSGKLELTSKDTKHTVMVFYNGEREEFYVEVFKTNPIAFEMSYKGVATGTWSFLCNWTTENIAHETIEAFTGQGVDV